MSPQVRVSNGSATGCLNHGSGAQPPPGLGHAQVPAQVSAPPGLRSRPLGGDGGGGGGGGGGGVELLGANVTYGTPEATELPPVTAVGLGLGLGLRERSEVRAEVGLGLSLGLEGGGEEEDEEVVDN